MRSTLSPLHRRAASRASPSPRCRRRRPPRGSRATLAKENPEVLPVLHLAGVGRTVERAGVASPDGDVAADAAHQRDRRVAANGEDPGPVRAEGDALRQQPFPDDVGRARRAGVAVPEQRGGVPHLVMVVEYHQVWGLRSRREVHPPEPQRLVEPARLRGRPRGRVGDRQLLVGDRVEPGEGRGARRHPHADEQLEVGLVLDVQRHYGGEIGAERALDHALRVHDREGAVVGEGVVVQDRPGRRREPGEDPQSLHHVSSAILRVRLDSRVSSRVPAPAVGAENWNFPFHPRKSPPFPPEGRTVGRGGEGSHRVRAAGLGEAGSGVADHPEVAPLERDWRRVGIVLLDSGSRARPTWRARTRRG